MKKPIKKADPLFYEKVGKFIELWLKENHKAKIKPGTSKELANMVHKTAPQIHRYIKGITKMPGEVMTHIIAMHGFNPKYYDNYITQKHDINLEHLTVEDTHRLIRELQLLNDKLQNMFYKYADANVKLQTDNRQFLLEFSHLIKENDELRKELREMRKQLKFERSKTDNFNETKQDCNIIS